MSEDTIKTKKEDTIKTKKKDKSVWKSLGMAAVAIGGLAVTIAKEMNKKQ